MFKGSITALITPFEGEGVDYDAFAAWWSSRSERERMGLCPSARPASCRR